MNRHDITEILLKVVLNTITPNLFIIIVFFIVNAFCIVILIDWIPVILFDSLILAVGFTQVVRFLFVKTATLANDTSHKLCSRYLRWWTILSAQLYVLREWNGMRILVLKIITLFRVWTQVLRKGRQFLLYILRCYCSGHNELTLFRNLHATTMINSQAYRIVTWRSFIEKVPLFTTPGHVVYWTMGIVTSIQCGLGRYLSEICCKQQITTIHGY